MKPSFPREERAYRAASVLLWLALLPPRAVLLLDEVISSLDVVTEATVDHNLRRFLCTQILVAH
ncbi:hypothetical protein KSZ_06220 [Dictyobacter formicarum]|uniref:RecF/RecN/SMC N-terminal domain-containing protein n=1 Tax=Dictyobacter formicarum TaxID=2778368 RepID=A0ABQ3VAW1_9CHLR|nr:hypothetical protein KSZ_06220 [Dictyobacter formicarum]